MNEAGSTFMADRRFVRAEGRAVRLGDSVRGALRGTLDRSPWAIAKVRAKRAELSANVDAGRITALRARVQYLRFASLVIAHVREHDHESSQGGHATATEP